MMNVLHRWQARLAAHREYKRAILAISRIAETDQLDLGEPTGYAVADARR